MANRRVDVQEAAGMLGTSVDAVRDAQNGHETPAEAPGGVVRGRTGERLSAPLVVAHMVRVRRLKGAALAVLRTLAVAAAIALIMLVVAVLVGVIVVGVDTLFR